jgi:Notch-like protein
MTRTNNFQCICPPGITGTFCQIDLDECLSYPCFNNGRCLQSDIGNYTCNCSNCFTGERCESLKPMCTNDTCSINGICVEIGPCKAGCLCEEGKLNYFQGSLFKIYISEKDILENPVK